MGFLPSDNLLDHIKNIVHKDTQLHATSFDLTVDEIYAFTAAGSLDFGGSEFKKAATELINPQKKNPDDDYGWWQLNEGSYKAVCNEQLGNTDKAVAFISPHDHARAAGLLVDTFILSSEGSTKPLAVNFRVPAVGCGIKENARFATLHIFEK